MTYPNNNANDNCHSHIEYLQLSAATVKEWYDRDNALHQSLMLQEEKQGGEEESFPFVMRNPQKGFVSIDGIHPNAKCYAFWAEFVAKFLLGS
mmetsp:Transcript_27101/g.62506  ORF Transcript_27101/g.62506 Transcript_27101/m.62506 type:complete len:93 (+) Transcript_27101:182-460(+)